jgi:hypothetical protein
MNRYLFPNAVLDDNCRITSPQTDDYNCIAWSIHVNDMDIWPGDILSYKVWPINLPREETVENFIEFYKLCGFELCDHPQLENGWEKVALYLKNGIPQHAARQIAVGHWESKLGTDADVQHLNLEVYESDVYGRAQVFFKRRVRPQGYVLPELVPKKIPKIIMPFK